MIEWNGYTPEKLRVLAAENSIAPLTASELLKLDEIKKIFNATIRNEI